MELKQAVNMARIMKAARISNCPARLDTAKLKKFALEHLRLDLQNRLEGLHGDEDASPEE